jgi:hypothetical protein
MTWLKSNRLYLSLAAIFLAVFVLSGCGKKIWTGYYYSNIEKMNDESTWQVKTGLRSLEDCREWIGGIPKYNNNYDYECGYGCRYEKDIRENVCKETFQ